MRRPSRPGKTSERNLLLFLLALFAAAGAPAEKVEQLKPQGYVSDFAGVISPRVRDQLTALCEEVDHKAGAQIAVVTVRSLEGVPIEEFSIDLATRWGIGPKGNSRGVLILLAVADHRYRTEVGYGLEPILPDGKVGGFGREAVPLLRQNDYGGALLLMARRVAEVIAQERGVTLGTLPPEAPPPGGRLNARRLPSLMFLATLFLVFVVFPLIGSLARLATGGFVGRRGRRGGGWWMLGGPWVGGSWGGGGFGGGGFGGFGGGSFGGGGAGGSW